jgi:hypothetical protein
VPPDDPDALDEETGRIYLEEHPAYDPRVALASRDHEDSRGLENLARGAPQRASGGGRGVGFRDG